MLLIIRDSASFFFFLSRFDLTFSVFVVSAAVSCFTGGFLDDETTISGVVVVFSSFIVGWSLSEIKIKISIISKIDQKIAFICFQNIFVVVVVRDFWVKKNFILLKLIHFYFCSCFLIIIPKIVLLLLLFVVVVVVSSSYIDNSFFLIKKKKESKNK